MIVPVLLLDLSNQILWERKEPWEGLTHELNGAGQDVCNEKEVLNQSCSYKQLLKVLDTWKSLLFLMAELYMVFLKV